MGNSEVGHLNLGAGSVVRQDLTRIDDAVLDGVLTENAAINHALTCSERVHLIGLVSDGGVHSSLGHLQALLELAGRLSVRDLVDPLLHRRPRHPRPNRGRPRRPRGTLVSRALAGRVAWPGARRPPSSAAGTRWTATAAGSASRPPTTCSSTAAPPTTRRLGCEAVRQAYERGETDEFIAPTSVGERGPDPPLGLRALLQLPPRPRARARPARWPSPALVRARRRCPAGRVAAASSRSSSTPPSPSTRKPGPTPSPSPPASRRHARLCARRRARPAAARRGDREVRPRHLLLQRRRGGPPRGRAAPARPLAPGRAHLRPRPRDVRPRRRRPLPRSLARAARGRVSLRGPQLRQPRHGRPHRRDPRRGARLETVDACLGEVVRAVLDAGGACLDHGRPRQRRAHARARRLPQHRPHLQPRAADPHRCRGCGCWRRRASSPTSPPPSSSCSASPSPRRCPGAR